MKQTIVKVQMPIDQARAARTGRAYIDLSMCNALEGQGSIKSFWLGTWDGSKWHLTEMTKSQDW